MQNKLDMLFQPSRVIERSNHSLMEYSLLSQCNHKARLDGPKACRLAWHPWLDSRSLIIFGRYDSVHRELFGIEPNNVSQIRLFIFQFLERFWHNDLGRSRKSGFDLGNRHPWSGALPLFASRCLKEFFMSGFVLQTKSFFVIWEFNESRAPTSYGFEALA